MRGHGRQTGLAAFVSFVNHSWRLAVTGACFTLFGIGGILLSTLVFPPMRLLPGGKTAWNRRVRRLVHTFFGMLIRTLRATGVMRLEVCGAERLRACGGMLVLPNHPTYLDVVVLISLLPDADCVVKGGLWRSPYFGGVVRATGYISNESPEALIKDCAASLAGGSPLILFPEGTRTVPGQPLHFLRGAAYVAVHSGRPMLPVLIDCDPPTLTKGEKWYRIPPRPFQMRLRVLEPIRARDLVEITEPPAIVARHLTEALEDYFTRQLALHYPPVPEPPHRRPTCNNPHPQPTTHAPWKT